MDGTDAPEFPSIVDLVNFCYDQELYVGMLFKSKKILNNVVKLYFVKKHHMFKVVKTNNNYIDLRCPECGKHCSWNLRAC